MKIMLKVWLPMLIGIVFFGCATQGREFVQENKSFSLERIEQLVAPIALYPDALIAQILIAATYPLEVVQAARWMRQNSKLSGEELQNALQYESWDPSIKSLIAFPTVLERMDKELNWTEDLGNAFLLQQTAIMDTVQKMRMRARVAGNLENTPYQSVIEKDRVIYITPARPNIIYVPEYNPTVVFANWNYPRIYYPGLFVTSPTIYWQEPHRQTFGLITFGLGVAVGAIFRHHIDWGERNIMIHEQHNYYGGPSITHVENVNVMPFKQWRHDPNHRHKVRYPAPILENNYRPEFSSSNESRPNPSPLPLRPPAQIENPPLETKEKRLTRIIPSGNTPYPNPLSTKDNQNLSPLRPPAQIENPPLETKEKRLTRIIPSGNTPYPNQLPTKDNRNPSPLRISPKQIDSSEQKNNKENRSTWRNRRRDQESSTSNEFSRSTNVYANPNFPDLQRPKIRTDLSSGMNKPPTNILQNTPQRSTSNFSTPRSEIRRERRNEINFNSRK